MMPKRMGIALALLTLPCLPSAVCAADKPDLMLAENFQATNNLSDYWISEKLDGIRAYWNGEAFITRNGNTIHAPDWFTRSLPVSPLDGELWMGRGEFQRLLSTVSKDSPIDSEWKNVKYMIFDLPSHLGNFDIRLQAMKHLLGNIPNRNIGLVKQFKVHSQEALKDKLSEIIAKGGEGLMLHRGSSLYQARRSSDLQKLKQALDAEAKVVGYIPAKGKYKGMMGSLLVETEAGIRFRIGSGFTLTERLQPPKIGSVITFRYRGKTSSNIPRFATYLRTKEQI
ncbi:DNA ligase [Hahella sp. CCB-MM4]|uniref:DNA ligase n=1 Tax=Hahella sp. (strain CCB-MM4) TaxID=1926491 RepID=UPI000BD8C135|nr:DNA ligase [Hahella sp. CCB-MM4]OZG74130.1 DNA ligase [Hahella sp. CCB-MM4]